MIRSFCTGSNNSLISSFIQRIVSVWCGILNNNNARVNRILLFCMYKTYVVVRISIDAYPAANVKLMA